MRAPYVLIVEDDSDALDVYRMILEAEGYRTVGATDGAEALARLRAEPDCAALIVLDLMLPHLDGRGFHAIKADDPQLARVPVIVVSAAAELASVQPAEDIKAVLPKPIPVDRLLDEVRRWTDAAQPVPERVGAGPVSAPRP